MRTIIDILNIGMRLCETLMILTGLLWIVTVAGETLVGALL